MAPPNWTDIEARFRGLLQTLLQPTRQWIRIDYQWSTTSDDDHWSVVASATNAAKAEFETLCTIAGDLLMNLPPATVAPEALAEPTAKHRWYLALWHHMTYKIPDHKAFAGPDDKIGTIFTGHIREPVELSATLCLRFSTVELPAIKVARFKESKVGKVLWWFGEEPLKKWLGAAVVAAAGVLIPPIRHAISAFFQWIVSRF